MKKYFFSGDRLYGIAVLYDYPIYSSWSKEYLFGIENALKQLSFDYQIVLQWIRIDKDSAIHDNTKNLLHQHVETGCQVEQLKD